MLSCLVLAFIAVILIWLCIFLRQRMYNQFMISLTTVLTVWSVVTICVIGGLHSVYSGNPVITSDIPYIISVSDIINPEDTRYKYEARDNRLFNIECRKKDATLIEFISQDNVLPDNSWDSHNAVLHPVGTVQDEWSKFHPVFSRIANWIVDRTQEVIVLKRKGYPDITGIVSVSDLTKAQALWKAARDRTTGGINLFKMDSCP